jgi:hypothetical protein
MALHIVSHFLGPRLGRQQLTRWNILILKIANAAEIQQNNVRMKVKKMKTKICQKIDWRTYSSPKIAAWDVGGFSSCM